MLTRRTLTILALSTSALLATPAWADEYQDTINVFRKAEESGKCAEGVAPVGFLYRFGDSISWNKAKIHMPGT